MAVGQQFRKFMGYSAALITMPNPFKDWARMYGANKRYLERGTAVVVRRPDRRYP